MLRFGKTKIAKEFYGAKAQIKIWEFNVNNIVISKFVETKNNSKYLIGYLEHVIRPLVLILPKMSRYVETFVGKGGDKNKNDKLISLRIDDNELFEKYKTIWTKIEDSKNIELDALAVYDGKCIKTTTRRHGDEFYTNFWSLNVPEDGVECVFFTVNSIDSLFVYKNK